MKTHEFEPCTFWDATFDRRVASPLAAFVRRQLSIVVPVETAQHRGGVRDLARGDDSVVVRIERAEHQDYPEVHRWESAFGIVPFLVFFRLRRARDGNRRMPGRRRRNWMPRKWGGDRTGKQAQPRPESRRFFGAGVRLHPGF